MTSSDNPDIAALNEARKTLMQREARMLVICAIIAGAAYVAFILLDIAIGAKPHAVDDWILTALRTPQNLWTPVGPRWLTSMAKDITALAGWPVLTIFTIVLGGYLLIRKEWTAFWLVMAAVIGESTLVSFVKGVVGEARPDVVPHLVAITDYSFPSGHSASAAAVYLTLGALLARGSETQLVRLYVVVVAILMTVIIGASRIYLGVHYPSDVLGGISIGAVWAASLWLAAYYLQHGRRRA